MYCIGLSEKILSNVIIIRDAVCCQMSNFFRYKLLHILFFILFLIVFSFMIIVYYRYMYMALPLTVINKEI